MFRRDVQTAMELDLGVIASEHFTEACPSSNQSSSRVVEFQFTLAALSPFSFTSHCSEGKHPIDCVRVSPCDSFSPPLLTLRLGRGGRTFNFCSETYHETLGYTSSFKLNDKSFVGDHFPRNFQSGYSILSPYKVNRVV